MDAQFDVKTLTGLSHKEAETRLKTNGPNLLPSSKKRNIFAIAGKILLEPMFLLLIAGGALYFILGNPTEALILVSFVFVIMGITLYQEQKTEKALETLKNLSSPRALVIRNGVEKRIAGRDVVCGDIIIVHEGDYVPADAELIASSNFAVDESLLTGESVAVHKLVGEDDKENIYASTLVVSGYGIAKVYGTALNTKVGEIGSALQKIEPEETPLQQMTMKLVRNLAIIGLSLCALVAFIYGITRDGAWLHGILAGITLAMAILPEEFPVILTTFLAIGAWRISREEVLTRRVPAVEALGSASVLCVDKTGTLTINEMRVQEIFTSGDSLNLSELSKQNSSLPEKFHALLEYSILATQRDPFDPMEKAIKQFGETHLANTEHLHKEWELIHEYPLSKELLAISHVWKSPTASEFEIATKGAPEAIIDLCHLTGSRADELLAQVKLMASKGLRVLGVAKAKFNSQVLPGEQHAFEFEFLGLVGLADPIRANVPAAIEKCHAAGIRVVMITGDHAETALNIAKKIGLNIANSVITGPELQKLSDVELRKRINTISVFARIVPEQKLRIVNALKANGEVVAMTGDGVNDAPALKAAHIGIAMGDRGTDVARAAADLVLLDDDFSSIVAAVGLGRRIFDNIKKAMTYTLAVHIPIIGLSLLPILFKWPLILLPVHIVFLELIIDPACSIVFEAEAAEANIMERAPRAKQETFFTRKLVLRGLLQGLVVLFIVLGVFSFAYLSGYSFTAIRALTFATLVFSNLGLIITNRSWSRNLLASLRTPNRALWWIIIGALLFLGLALYVPWAQHLFHFASLSFTNLIVAFAAGILAVVCFEVVKFFRRRVVHETI